jgi:glutathione S-transferase
MASSSSPSPSPSRPDIHLYTAQTPNGIKISITLEELGLPYTVHRIDISTNAQKEPWFLAINPNGRIPALTDAFADEAGGGPIRLFESGSIQLYLVERYDREYKISYPRGTREYYEVNNWVCVFFYFFILFFLGFRSR